MSSDKRWKWPFGRAQQLGAGRLHYAERHLAHQGAVRNRLGFAGAALVVVCALGTAGYYVIGGGEWLLEDCLYMVLITITSVGYGEVLPLVSTESGRVFTMALLLAGMGVSFYFLSALTAFIIEGDLREALWRRRMLKRLAHFDGHYIVCGIGRTGMHVTEELMHANCQVVVIDTEQRQLDELQKLYGAKLVAIEGDATDDRILKDAGIERAKGLVTALKQDQDNLYVSLSARQLNRELRIVSRANADRVTAKLQQAGADAIVSPTHIGGRRMAHELLRPTVVGFLDFISRDVRRSLDIEELEIPAKSPLVGVTLATSKIRQRSAALVLAVIGRDGEPKYNPPPDQKLDVGMTLIVMGEPDQLERLRVYIQPKAGFGERPDKK
jgi:voltage-gated potassium channel